MVQVYVVAFPDELAPTVEIQEFMSAVPEILQFMAPPGAAALFEPVTIAVNVSVPPKVGDPEAETVIEGAALLTTVEFDDATAPTGLYAPPPVKVKVAEYVPVTPASTLQLYVETFDAWVGPLVVVQLVIPVTPIMFQVPPVVGAVAPVGPVAVAVKTIVEPRDAVVEFALTAITGAVSVTVVVEPEDGVVAK